MTTIDQNIEADIQAKGANVAPRVTSADIDANIVSEYYFTAADGVASAGPIVAHEFHNLETGHAIADYSAHTHVGHLSAEKGYTDFPLVKKGNQDGPLGLITICVLITRNGTKLVGANEGPVSPENSNPELGRKYARQKAIDQLWPMLGYELRTKLTEPGPLFLPVIDQATLNTKEN